LENKAPAAQFSVPGAVRLLPPLTEEKSPLAMLFSPPLTEELRPLAVLLNPPQIEAPSLLVLFNLSCHLLKSMGFCLTLTVKSPISPQEEPAHGRQNYHDVLSV
jgi:hypothetical protein